MTDLSITRLLARNAQTASEGASFRYLAFDGGDGGGAYTWSELYAHALGFAHVLTDRGLAGQRALLVYDTGIDFQVAFLGCLLAGVTAVPAPPPRQPYSRSLHRLAGIQRDCTAGLVIARHATVTALREHLATAPEPVAVDWLTVDEVAPSHDESGLRPFTMTDTAYLQYTSGSTSQPKGVQVTQADVLANCAAMHDAWRHEPDSVLVSWLPMFHDMGLVYCALLPVVHAMPTVLMAPTAFAREPVRWLRAMHEFGATHSIAPNFGFDLSVRKIAPEQTAGLDLSRWQVAVNASEPIRAASLRRFSETFAGIGFRKEALLPAYGLAEATLMVTSARAGAGPLIRTFDRDALAGGVGRPARTGQDLVSCGSALAGFDIRVVEPGTGTTVPDGQCGEVWVAGPSVTAGYFRHPDATTASFGATPADGTPGYLRTGDIGFLYEDELFVTSRLKDLIIAAGRNHHPHDLEATAFDAHPALRAGCAAAFAVDDGAEEHVVIVQEVTDDAVTRGVAAEAVAAVRRAVAEAHELRVDAVVLIRKATLAKTSSGKVQRSACRQQYVDGTLDVIASWRGTLFGGTGEMEPAGDAPSPDGIRTWLRAKVAALTGLAPSAIADTEPLAGYGLSSMGAAELAGALAEAVGRALPEIVLYDHPTIDRLTAALTGTTAHPGAAEPVPIDVRHGSTSSGRTRNDIAVVGIGCRLPGATSPGELWQLLRSGTDAVREVPPTRWPRSAEPALRWAGLVDDLTGLDTAFFGISPREASAMDPQQRMLLAVAWEAVEDAGMDPAALAGSDTGVFVGVWSPEFVLQAGPGGFTEPYLTTGSAHSIAANRLSYAMDLHGPSLAVDTACSSSLVAVHLASRSLLDGECSVALAGGCNIVLSPEVSAAFARAHLLSPTGRCRSFGADADGYVRAEGAGVVVLKRLADALADGDDVYAVIKGSAVNHDGRTNGLTAPSNSAQQAVIRAAHRRAGVRGPDIDLVEAHGSGTPVGDLIEATALGATVGADRTGTPCVIGSVKSNVGHLEAAAGVAGLIRAALALKHGEVPPTLHADEVNPRIDLPSLGLRVNTAAVPLTGERPALAGVSSFGFGGANAHVVLAQAKPVSTPPTGGPARAMLLPVSARNKRSLARLAQRYRTLLADPTVPVAAVCHSAGRRAQHDLRAGVVGADRAELLGALDRLAGVLVPAATPLVFAFGEAGSTTGLGARLFIQEEVFRHAVDECADVVRSLAGWTLADLLLAAPGDLPAELSRPLRVAVHIGLIELLAGWGIRPASVAGSGVGAISARYAAGSVNLTAAMTLALSGSAVPETAVPDGPATVVDFQAGLAGGIPVLSPGADDRAGLLALAGRLYETGHRLDWAAITGTTARHRLPAYPWDTVALPLPGSPAAQVTAAVTAAVVAPVAPPTVSTAARDYRELIRRAAADLLGMAPERVDNHSTFSHLGMDSLTGVDLHERLELELGTELPQTAVLNYPTVARMADFLTTIEPKLEPSLAGSPERTDEQVVDELIADLAGLLPDLLDSERSGGN
jgi:acyl-CoA synthetase (AMP-forming)/AMP-acid ligase II/3-oxoacyl-(acyl-carrier-protein) synthase/acyl carrier protein